MADSWNKIKNLVIGLKNLSTIGSANAISALISGAFWFYVATLLGTEQFGKVNYIIAIAAIACIISYLGAGNTVIIYTAKEKKIQASVYFIAIISSVVTSIILFFIFYDLGASLYIVGGVIFGLAVSELLGRKLYKDFAKYVITQRFLLVLLAMGLYYMIGPGGVILGFALSYFPYTVRIYKGLRGSKIDMSIIKSRSGFMMNSYAIDLSNVMTTSADKLIIVPLFGFALLGNYQLGIQFLTILSILPSTVFQYLLPSYATGNPDKKLKIATILFSIALAIGGILLVPIVFPLLFPQFKEAIEIIQIMSLAIIPISTNFMYNAKFLGMQKSKVVLIGSCIYLSVQILGIFILGNMYGINGTGAALVLSASAQAIYYIIVNRTVREKELS